MEGSKQATLLCTVTGTRAAVTTITVMIRGIISVTRDSVSSSTEFCQPESRVMVWHAGGGEPGIGRGGGGGGAAVTSPMATSVPVSSRRLALALTGGQLCYRKHSVTIQVTPGSSQVKPELLGVRPGRPPPGAAGPAALTDSDSESAAARRAAAPSQ